MGTRIYGELKLKYSFRRVKKINYDLKYLNKINRGILKTIKEIKKNNESQKSDRY